MGGANGTLNGDAPSSWSRAARVETETMGSSVTLPAGILGGLDEVTIETWATFPGAINPYANLFAFGRTDTTAAGSQSRCWI